MQHSLNGYNSLKKKTSGLKSLPISLIEFKKEFDRRHDFDSEDLDVLKEKFPDIKFSNIPEAWIILIDKMVREAGPIDSVKQYFGMLFVDGNSSSTILKYEKRLYLIDKDLHEMLDKYNG